MIRQTRLVCLSRRVTTGGTITAIRLQAKDSTRVSVYLDDVYGFGLAKILAVSLRQGQLLSDEAIADLQRRDSEERAYQQACRWIARRPRSEAELARYFERKGVDPSAQAGVIQRLRQAGMVDDRAFAEAWVENRMAFRPRSAWALRVELKQKGVDSADIDAALSDFDEEEAALLAARKAARRWRQADQALFRKRVGGYLRRRGFHLPIIRAVVEQVWGEATEHESEVRE